MHSTWSAWLLLVVALLGGCKESKREQCARVRGIVTEEMHASSAFDRTATLLEPGYAAYAAALRKANAAARAMKIADPALRDAVEAYRTATKGLAASYDGMDPALEGGTIETRGSAAGGAMIFITMINATRMSIADACPD